MKSDIGSVKYLMEPISPFIFVACKLILKHLLEFLHYGDNHGFCTLSCVISSTDATAAFE